MIHKDELIFEFGDFHLIYSFELKQVFIDELDNDYYSFNTIEDIDEIAQLLSEVDMFTSLEIKGYEFLGWREDMTEVSSISVVMYAWLKKLFKFSDNVVNQYRTYVDFGDAMCDVDGNYFYSIEINEIYWWNIDLIENHLINGVEKQEFPNFYTIFFRKNEPIKDYLSPPILSTNTKVRRLGYFKILANFLEERKKTPAKSININFENYCVQYKDQLENYTHTKGLIKQTKTGISARPYIDLCNDLDFLNRINNVFYTGKSFKVYQLLKSKYQESNNVFELSEFDRLYFLEHILRNDFFYFTCLLELIYIEEKAEYRRLIQKYQAFLIMRLKKYRGSNSFGDRQLKNDINSIINRIQNWEKPEVYLEHILMPRLNWMLDLNLLFLNKNHYELSTKGIKLFQHLCIWNDLNTQEVISPNAFLDLFMVHLFDDTYREQETVNPIESIVKEKLFKHIEDSFELFKTLAPNRVTASQAANYTKYKLYFDDKIKVGYQYILGKLSEKEQGQFIFKYQEQYHDGYIQKK